MSIKFQSKKIYKCTGHDEYCTFLVINYTNYDGGSIPVVYLSLFSNDENIDIGEMSTYNVDWSDNVKLLSFDDLNADEKRAYFTFLKNIKAFINSINKYPGKNISKKHIEQTKLVSL